MTKPNKKLYLFTKKKLRAINFLFTKNFVIKVHKSLVGVDKFLGEFIEIGDFLKNRKKETLQAQKNSRLRDLKKKIIESFLNLYSLEIHSNGINIHSIQFPENHT